jgi:hypothetical protein
MAREVEIHAAAKPLGTEQRVLHPDDLGALFVHGRRVEIIDLEIFVRSHVVRHRPGIFGELLAAQIFDRCDALDRAGIEIAREFLVAEHGQAFLQRQLEPVATGDAVAGPVVEIFVADHAFDRRVVVVGGGRRVRQHEPAVEDVEALVLHRAHVEVIGAEDHERIEVVFAAEALLVPRKRALDRRHRMMAARDVHRRRIDPERDAAAGHRS